MTDPAKKAPVPLSPSPRHRQQLAAAILVNLLTRNLPECAWRIRGNPAENLPVLDGQVTSDNTPGAEEDAVHAWARALGLPVTRTPGVEAAAEGEYEGLRVKVWAGLPTQAPGALPPLLWDMSAEEGIDHERIADVADQVAPLVLERGMFERRVNARFDAAIRRLIASPHVMWPAHVAALRAQILAVDVALDDDRCETDLYVADDPADDGNLWFVTANARGDDVHLDIKPGDEDGVASAGR